MVSGGHVAWRSGGHVSCFLMQSGAGSCHGKRMCSGSLLAILSHFLHDITHKPFGLGRMSGGDECATLRKRAQVCLDKNSNLPKLFQRLSLPHSRMGARGGGCFCRLGLGECAPVLLCSSGQRTGFTIYSSPAHGGRVDCNRWVADLCPKILTKAINLCLLSCISEVTVVLRSLPRSR